MTAAVTHNADTAAVITVSGVSKTYKLYPSHQDRLKEALHPFRKRYHEEFSALTDISFEIRRGECVGILGRNGAGKSTLLQLIAGVAFPSRGAITVGGNVAALLELGAGFNPDLTGRENVVLVNTIQGVPENQIAERVKQIEVFADIGTFFDQPMKIYSSGMYARVAFANAIHVNPELLIVDEILGVGDALFQEKCFRKLDELRSRGVAILFVSHAINTILDICDRCILLDKGRLIQVGNAFDVVNSYHAMLYSGEAFSRGSAADENFLGTAIGNIPEYVVSENENPVVARLLCDTDLVERMASRASYNKNNFRTGDGRAQILDYAIVCGNDEDARFIPVGALVDVYLKVLFHEDVKQPVVGIAIVKVDGIQVYGTNTQLMSIGCEPVRRGQRCVYRIEFRNDLVGGDYFLNLGVSTHSPEGKIIFLDNVRSLAHVEMERTPAACGLIDLRATIEVVGKHP